MGSVWKRLQRVNKRAAKFQFTVSYHQLTVETTPKWVPNKLSVVWTRRSRRVVSSPLSWEPTLQQPLRGLVLWPVPDNHSVCVTLFKDQRNEFEDKDWTFVIEDVAANGKRRQIASCAVNMKKYASIDPSQHDLQLNFRPATKKITSAKLECTLSCVFVREGKATDEDMQSMASLMSANNNGDIAPLEDFEDEDISSCDNSLAVSNGGVLQDAAADITSKIEHLTNSLSYGSDFPSTPISVASIQSELQPLEDKTPTAPVSSDKTLPHPAFTETESDPYSESCLECLEGLKDDPTIAVTPDGDYGTLSRKKPIDKQAIRTKEKQLPVRQVSSGLLRLELPTPKTPTSTVSKEFIPPPASTPGQDLLDWCKQMTAGYEGVRVTNLTTSWRNGLAFCALIHRYRPDLIGDWKNLDPHDTNANCRRAFEAGDALGVPRVIEPSDMDVLAVPDRLAVMTYLHQLRAYFAGSSNNRLPNSTALDVDSSQSYTIGSFSSDTETHVTDMQFDREIIELRNKQKNNKTATLLKNLLSQDSSTSETEIVQTENEINMQNEQEDNSNTKQPEVEKIEIPVEPLETKCEENMKNENLQKTKESSPVQIKEKTEDSNVRQLTVNITDAKPPILMTRRELVDPFGSDDEEEKPSDNQQNNEDNIELPKSAQHLIARHDELREKARKLLMQVRNKDSNTNGNVTQNNNGKAINSNKGLSEEERQAQLRERARRIIADARMGIAPNEIIQKANQEEVTNIRSSLEQKIQRISELSDELNNAPLCTDVDSIPQPENNKIIDSEERNGNALEPSSPVNQMVGGLLPLHLADPSEEISIERELNELEREQNQVDAQAVQLEKRLRAVMDTYDNEDELLAEWFELVNKKNALLRRQMQLNIIEKENELKRQYVKLNDELHELMLIDDWRKTDAQRAREKYLINELVQIVNKRDENVHHLHIQEKAIEQDEMISHDLSQIDLHKKQQCSLQ